MKTKSSLFLLVLLFTFSFVKAQDKITIGVIQYDHSDIDKSFKECLGELGKIGSLIKNKGILPPQELQNLLNEIKILRDFAYGENNNKNQ